MLTSTLIEKNFLSEKSHSVHSSLSLLSIEYTSVSAIGMESLLASLMQLGFLLIDTVKKDSSMIKKSSFSASTSMSQYSVASSGRDLLANLFLNGSDALRRAILAACSTRVCGRAPNATEHAKLLTRLASDQQTISLLAEFTGNIVEWLTYIPSGGISSCAVMSCIVPCLRVLLTVRKSYVDQTFLLSKKALFCTHESQRRCAAKLLIMLLEVVSDDVTNTGFNTSVVDELRGYIRRSLTQQAGVRSSIYKAIFAGIERECNSDEVKQILIQILHRHIEKYLSISEEKSEMIARQKRGVALGSQLSQPNFNNSGNEHEEEIPFRVDACTSNLITSFEIINGTKGKRKNPNSTLSLIREATEKISEPVVDLISVCSRAEAFCPESDLSACLRKLCDQVSKASTKSLIPETGDRLSHIIVAIDLSGTLIETCNLTKDNGRQLPVVQRLFNLRSKLFGEAALLFEKDSSNSKRQKKVLPKNKENVGINTKNLRPNLEKLHEKLKTTIQDRECRFSISFLSSFLDYTHDVSF